MRLSPFLVGLCLCTPPSVQSADTAVRARYHVLTAQPHAAPPFGAVDLISGPAARVGNMNQYWWQLELRPQPGATPLMVLRALTSLNPQTDASTNTQFLRYQLRLPDLGETLEYRDRHTGLALLPAWGDFIRHFVPQPAKCAQRQDGATETLELLGHVLTLSSISRNEPWAEWNEVKVLDLDPELLVGTGRNFKDSEGRRLPQKPERQNYTYVPFTEADYRVMFEAGINLFTVSPAQEPWVRAEPVFYLRGAEGKPASLLSIFYQLAHLFVGFNFLLSRQNEADFLAPRRDLNLLQNGGGVNALVEGNEKQRLERLRGIAVGVGRHHSGRRSLERPRDFFGEGLPAGGFRPRWNCHAVFRRHRQAVE